MFDYFDHSNTFKLIMLLREERMFNEINEKEIYVCYYAILL